ncbi:MAG: hypothetical protein P4L84_20850 [Isosphaeraceae bacterium]|nr:hypothetical protein [Isosphaeraceae bacterium]
MSRVRFWRAIALLGAILAGVVWLAWPEVGPVGLGLALATTAYPLLRAWRGARGTALRAAVIWAVLATGLAIASQILAALEPVASGRPLAGHVAYLAVLATLATLISVLNARTPGGGAWAILMALLVLVFLIPWLEAPGLARRAHGLERLRLDAPWTLFYGLVVLAGVTNYLPTRYGRAGFCLAVGFVAEYLGLTHRPIGLPRGVLLASGFPWALALALWTADRCSRQEPPARSRLEATWLWFRDHWGVVWALRVQERFNRTAEVQGWPVRLGWFGVAPEPGMELATPPEVSEAAESTLRGLLRRFAEPARIDAVTGPCQSPDEVP